MEQKVILSENQKDLTILTGKALDSRPPIPLSICGTIESVSTFLEKRGTEINQKECHILSDFEDRSIALILHETDAFYKGTVEGKIEISDQFGRFKINTGESWSCHDLADFIKANRSFFESKEVAGKLVNELRNFKAKVDREVELIKDDRANYSAKRSQVVNSSLPSSFTILAKVFKNKPYIPLTVEINIHPESLNCILISPDANDYIQVETEKFINAELTKIQEIAPELVIIQQ